MKEIYKFVFYILCFILLMVPISCLHLSLRRQEDPPTKDDEPVIVSTTEDENAGRLFSTERVTDLPESKILDALNMDVGSYSTVHYYYDNYQWMHGIETDHCYDFYTKCLTSLAAPMPVCLAYGNWFMTFYRVMNTYCDGYLENCRVGYRYWRTVAYGRCRLSFPLMRPYMDDY